MAWHHRILNIFRSNRISRDIQREIDFHIAERVDSLVAGGMSEAEARLVARRQFGNVGAQHEQTRRMDIADWLQSVAGDVRYAIRAMIHSPVFAVVTISSLGLGIGANTTIFTLLDTVVLRPLDVDRPSELAYVAIDSLGAPESSTSGDVYFTNPIWEQVRDRQNAFSAISAFGKTSFDLAEGGEAHRVAGAYVSGDFFRTFGVTPAAGRLIAKADDVRGCQGLAVLGYRFWEREYGSAPNVVGQTIRLNGRAVDIAGISESSFRGPDVGWEADVYLPICALPNMREGSRDLDARSTWWLRVIGRQAPDVDVRQARVRMAAIARATFEETIPQHWRVEDQRAYVTRTLRVVPAERGFSGVRADYSKALVALMAGVVLILLIACANVANLLLSRAEARHRELAIRLAIGAGRGRMLRQLVTESMVLAIAGALVGLFVARAGTSALVTMIATGHLSNTVSLDLTLNWRLLAFTAFVASVTVALCGLYPAWRATRVSAQSAMKAQARGVVEGHSRFRLGKSLVVAQVALSLVLIVSAGFLMRTLNNLSRLDPGFTADGVLLAGIDLRRAGVPAEAASTLQRQILERIRLTPGVVAASSSELTPIGGSYWNEEIVIDGYTPKSTMDAVTWFNEVSDGYFAALGTRLLGGRDFAATDVPGSEKVVIVNDAWARHFVANQSPLGRSFQIRDNRSIKGPYTIVGLVENSKYRELRDTAEPIAYLPSSQSAQASLRRTVEARTRGPAASLIPAVRQALNDVNPRIIVDFETLSGQLAASLQRERMLAVLSLLFGSVALALAVLGLYGVMAYSVERRRQELGVRIALGAVRARVVRLVLSEVGTVLVMGLVIGVVGARVASTQVAPFLYGAAPADPGVYVSAAIVLATVALIAGFIPAWRAARVDPIEALRQD
ncbi:MAG TPA: ABC transporter permease [Gemmatimonadaceae bacterium]|jgi:predicted permease|nr:ABC transporter permease [Gemmatimonadaceae bacterium]